MRFRFYILSAPIQGSASLTFDSLPAEGETFDIGFPAGDVVFTFLSSPTTPEHIQLEGNLTDQAQSFYDTVSAWLLANLPGLTVTLLGLTLTFTAVEDGEFDCTGDSVVFVWFNAMFVESSPVNLTGEDCAPQTLIPEPVGWADAVFSIKRDIDLHGVFFQYVATLKFYDEAYDIINAEYIANGVEGDLRLLIQFACSDTDVFEDLYISKLNFSKIEFENSDVCLVGIPIEDDNALTMLKNRQDQKVDLTSGTSLDGLPLVEYTNLPTEVVLRSKAIVKTDAASFADDAESSITSGTHSFVPSIGSVPDIIEDTLYHWVGFPKFEQELDPVEVGFNKAFVNGTNLSENVADTLWEPSSYFFGYTYFFDVVITALIDIWVDIAATVNEVNCSQNGGFDSITVNTILRRFNTDTLVYTDIVIGTQGFSDCYANTASSGGTAFGIPSAEVTINVDYHNVPFASIASNERVILVFEVKWEGLYDGFPGGPFTVYTQQQLTMLNASTFKISTETLYPTTNADLCIINEALSRTVESITNDQLRVYSDYYGRTEAQPYTSAADGLGSHRGVTKGTKIRGTAIQDMLFSFKDLYDNSNAIDNIGMGLEPDPNRAGFNWLRIEQARYFYNDTVVLVLDKVPDITRRVLSEEHYSIFEFGYSKWQMEKYNNLDEFNTRRSYRTTLKSVKNTLNRVCDFIASGYAIEVTRQQNIFTTKDWKFDNDEFIICLVKDNPGPFFNWAVEMEAITSPANLIDPDTVYNFRISPNRNLLRWLPKILASYNEPTEGELIFMSGEGNFLAEGQMLDSPEAGVLSESESPVTVDTLASPGDGLPYYELEEWSFEYPMSASDYRDVIANPHGLVQVRYGQNSDFTDCYIRQIEWKPAGPNGGKAQFTLLPRLRACVDGIGCWIIEFDFEVQ